MQDIDGHDPVVNEDLQLGLKLFGNKCIVTFGNTELQKYHKLRFQDGHLQRALEEYMQEKQNGGQGSDEPVGKSATLPSVKAEPRGTKCLCRHEGLREEVAFLYLFLM